MVVNVPPQSGPNAGSSGYVEVLVNRQATTNFIQVLGVNPQQTVSVRSVAGALNSTAGSDLTSSIPIRRGLRSI